MHSERAAALLAELEAIYGGKLRVPCASVRLDVDREGVQKAIRELVATGHVTWAVYLFAVP